MVLQAAEELGWRPNRVARNLAERRTRTIGVLVSDLHNPFFAEIIDGLQSEARGRDLRVLLGTGRRDSEEEAEVVESFLQESVEGLVFLSPVLSRESLLRAASTVPTVVVGTTVVRVPRCDIVINDDAVGAGMAVSHLTARGHERIAHIDAQSGPGAAERRAGYLTAMAEHGLEPLVAAGAFTDEGGYRGALELLEGGRAFTAIFACNDVAAIGAMTALEEAGLSVPDDVSLVGYDNTSLAAMRHIGLTSVDQPRRDMGELTVELLERRSDRPHAPSRVRLVQPHLVERGSTAAVRRRSRRAAGAAQ